MNKKTTSAFVQEACTVHDNRYDYSRVVYSGWNIPVEIICPVHGSFSQWPTVHLRGSGCTACAVEVSAINQSKGYDQFIADARRIHGHFYDYSQVVYVNATKRVDIICPQHGSFQTTPGHHLRGVGCPVCVEEVRLERMREHFVLQARQVHGDLYDYQFVEYQCAREKVAIHCSIHGVFYQSPNSHVKGAGCPICGQVQRSINKQLSLDEFRCRARQIHGDSYAYPDQPFGGLTGHKIIITCHTHGDFMQAPRKHIAGHGCPLCQESRGEREIALLLDAWGVSYERQKQFSGLRRDRALAFDFYLPETNTLIEYDGPQHFEPVEYFGGEEKHRAIKESDAFKDQWARRHGILLIRIPHTEGDIAAVLQRHLL